MIEGLRRLWARTGFDFGFYFLIEGVKETLSLNKSNFGLGLECFLCDCFIVCVIVCRLCVFTVPNR